jgi:hypothetical protein
MNLRSIIDKDNILVITIIIVASILFIIGNNKRYQCLDIDEQTSWTNVDGTTIRVITRDKEALVHINVGYTGYQLHDSSKIVFNGKKICEGKKVTVDGQPCEVNDIFSVMPRSSRK